VDATASYLDDEDQIKSWRDACCEDDREAMTPISWLWNSWVQWAEKAGEYVGKMRQFTTKLEAAGYERAPVAVRVGGAPARVFRGIRISAASPAAPDVPPDRELPY
jgi:phage/plasmid-associated DNA primase